MKEAHLRDAVALCDFFSFLEDHIVAAGGKLTEVQVDQELTARRAKQPGFIGPSFATIAGEGKGQGRSNEVPLAPLFHFIGPFCI